MAKVKLTFNIVSYWHAGSGTGEGANLDSVVIKTPAGLPYIPGKTVKGLIRDAVRIAETFNKIDTGKTVELFGSNDSSKSRFDTDEGKLSFTSAMLNQEMEEWAQDPANYEKKDLLFYQLGSTKIDDRGLAVDQSLRRLEVAVPLVLSAYVEADDNGGNWVDIIKKAAPLVCYIGSHRRRGLGRNILTVEEVS